jgi:prepilin-type N-terminal cleavage/methylation domain-containing protein
LRPGDPRGFTLLEAVVALALAGMVLSAALAVAGADQRASRRAVQVETAASLADDVLSRAELATPDELEAWTRGVEGRFAPPLDRFAWRMRSAPVPGVDGLAAVTVEVAWPEGSFTATTRVAALRPLPGAP